MENGTLLETTCPHTPQRNRVVERKHSRILQIAHALKFEANLPTHIFREIARALINRKTPDDEIFNQKPDYDHLRVFGCLVYARNTDTKGDKFEVRWRPGVIIGYPQCKKEYHIFDFKSKKVIIFRDMNFVENKFPFL